MKLIVSTVIIFLVLVGFYRYLNFRNVEISKNDLNLHIPLCQNSQVKISEFQNSNGVGYPATNTSMYICHNTTHLTLEYQNQDYYIKNDLLDCNENLYTQDVNEVFLAGADSNWMEHYTELEFSPMSTLFASRITNNGVTFSGDLVDCKETGIQVNSSINYQNNYWQTIVNIPFEFILGQNYKQLKNQNMKGNFFRIDLTEYNECSGTENCYYYAYNPTLVSPPSFHKPAYFVDLIFDQN